MHVVLDQAELSDRMDRLWPVVESRLRRAYGSRPDCEHWLGLLRQLVQEMAQARPADLSLRDRTRAQWWVQGRVVGYSAYVDRFAGDLRGVRDRLPYLKDLGVTYLHLLPLLKAREGENDGGFAVSDFGVVDPRFGANADLEDLARKAHEADVALVVDLVCNHTADDHAWAKAARAGEERFKDYYIVVPDFRTVEAYEATLIDVFPDVAPGNFTHSPEMGGWVWTTFYPFQWDLNYANPAVFCEMTAAMLKLANLGVDGLRLDSAPFLWKRLGTDCRNLPEVHCLLAAWRAILAIAAPSVVLKAEAIERLDDVTSYFGADVAEPECHLAYNNGAMTALWAALALGEAEPLRRLVEGAGRKPGWGTWVNYVRCHDDIIWSALTPYLGAEDQRRCSAFFAGHTAGSFSAGAAFQAVRGAPPSTNGMAAALVGLVGQDPPPEAVKRLCLLYGVSFALDGFPLIWMGDEIALAGGTVDEDKVSACGDGRWLQRPFMDWERAALHADPATLAGRVFAQLAGYVRIRRDQSAFDSRHVARPSKPNDPAILSFVRGDEGASIQCLANFSGRARMSRLSLKAEGWLDLLSRDTGGTPEVALDPYQVRWLVTHP